MFLLKTECCSSVILKNATLAHFKTLLASLICKLIFVIGALGEKYQRLFKWKVKVKEDKILL